MAHRLVSNPGIKQANLSCFIEGFARNTCSEKLLVHRSNPMKQLESLEAVTMAIRPVRQSASKDEFLKALNLDLSHADERQVFSTMWEEVTQYWVQHFETSSRAVLKDTYRRNMGVKQPYKWGHLSQEAIDLAIAEIWRSASHKSLRYYNQGHSAEPSVKNWILKWLLWHVSRYRDERNNKKNRLSESSSPDSPLCPSMAGEHESAGLGWRDKVLTKGVPIPLRVHDSYLSHPGIYADGPSIHASPATSSVATPVSSVASTVSPGTSRTSPTTPMYSEDFHSMSSSVASASPEFSEEDNSEEKPPKSKSSEPEYWKTVMNGKPPRSEGRDKEVKRCLVRRS